jgi:cell division protein FtsW
MIRRYDPALIFSVLLLLGVGWIMIYSSSAVMADTNYHDTFRFLKRQLVFSLIGLIAMTAAMSFDYRRLEKLAYPILIASIVLLTLVLLPGLGFSRQVGVARRWLATPWCTIQPSEIAKLALVIFMAHCLTKKGDKMKHFYYGFLPVVVVTGVMIVLVVVEPDFGTAIFMGLLTMVLLFIGGTRLSHILSIPLFTAPVLYLLVTHYHYSYRRILAFLDPWKDIQGMGFQIIQSFVALASGGLWGLGLGDGRQKLFFLPAAHTDFILAIIGEELGFIGMMSLVMVFGILIWRGVSIALKAEDTFGAYLAMGITAMIALQVIINMGVVVGLLPTKGLTLPFVSYGGTSLVVNLVAAGVLANISAGGVQR